MARNNFGDAKLLLAVNQAILDRQKDLTTVEMSMLMGSLYDLDRVTQELNEVFQNYFAKLSEGDSARTVTSLIKASWSFL
jgi:hypothetical protein